MLYDCCPQAVQIGTKCDADHERKEAARALEKRMHRENLRICYEMGKIEPWDLIRESMKLERE